MYPLSKIGFKIFRSNGIHIPCISELVENELGHESNEIETTKDKIKK